METPAQYTERLREKYKEALERLEKDGPTKLEAEFDRVLTKKLDLKVQEVSKLEKLSDILSRY